MPVQQRVSGVDPALAERLYRDAKAERWRLPQAAFTAALETSCAKAFPGAQGERAADRFLASLHLEDLALACACALGNSEAWDHFVLEMRPQLYRAADALDRSGGARELADSLYSELYGLDQRGEARQSLLRYFHGRSSLATWLRAVLAQRYVDRMRAGRRTESLPEDVPAMSAAAAPRDPDCARFVEMLRTRLQMAVARLEPRDRLRLGCYYAQQLTLAQTGKLLKEHEATTSRQLARTRAAVRTDVEQQLRVAGLNDVQIARCFECATEDVGDANLDDMLGVRSG